jgi:hypothetical protein
MAGPSGTDPYVRVYAYGSLAMKESRLRASPIRKSLRTQRLCRIDVGRMTGGKQAGQQHREHHDHNNGSKYRWISGSHAKQDRANGMS